MSKIVKDLFGGSECSDSSKKVYSSYLRKLNDGVVPTKLDYLKDTEKIIEKIEAIENPNTKRSAYISIVTALKNKKPYKKYYDIYHAKMMGVNAILNKESFKTDKTKERQENVKMEDVLTRQKELSSVMTELQKKRKITDEQYERLHDLVVASLYTLLPPRRSLDFSAMVVGESTENKELNYYHNGKFYFNNFKTKKTGTQIVDVPQELQDILKMWIKFKKGEDKHLLLRLTTNEPYTAHDMTQLLKKSFNNKDIGISVLRNVYLSTNFGDIIKDLKKDAEDMGTSMGTALGTYIKKD
jgi:hypothetical protein